LWRAHASAREDIAPAYLARATRQRWAIVIRLPDFLCFRFAPLEQCIRRPIYGAQLASLHRP
jgi:hypothetical protein